MCKSVQRVVGNILPFYSRNLEEACCSIPSRAHIQTHRCVSSLVDCWWPWLIELAKGSKLCSWGWLSGPGHGSGELRGEMVAWLWGPAEQLIMTPADTLPSLRTVLHLFPWQRRKSKELPQTFIWGVWTTLRPPQCPKGTLSWLGEWEQRRNKAKQWTLSN